MKKLLLTALAVAATTGAMAQGQYTILTEDFNSGLPTGWTQVTQATDGGFNFGSPSSLSSSYFTIPNSPTNTNIAATNDDDCNCNKSAEQLITDTVDLSLFSKAHVSLNSYYYNAAYQGAQETAKLQYSTNGGTTWTDAGSFGAAGTWITSYFDVSAAAGNSDVQFAIFYGDGGGWNYGLGVDDFAVFVPYNFDAAVVDVDLYETQGLNNAPYTIEGTLVNTGGQTITSLTLNYTVNGGTAVTQSLTGLSIAPYDTYTFSHGTTWTPSATGTYDLDVFATGINGSVDQNNANDTLSKTITVVSSVADRVVLAEEFTSSTCGPCASFNPGYNTMLEDNDVNTAAGTVTSIKYQMNWPSPGNDPAYNDEALARRTYYGVTGVPMVHYDGTQMTGNQANLDATGEIPALIELDATWGNSGWFITCDVEVEALASISGDNVLRVALIEKEINHNVQTNGETEFFHVFRTFMPDEDGYALGNLTAGQTYTRYEQKMINVPTHTDPVQGSYDFWVGVSNMDVIVFVQNDDTGEILQSTVAAYNPTSVDEMDGHARYMKLYPNPASDAAGLEIDLLDASDVTVNVVNALGETVLTSVQSLDAGTQTIELNTSELSAGMYFVNINVNGVNKTLRLNVAH